MPAERLSTWLLEQETRALLTRLDRVKPFALQEPMLPAAALTPAAQIGIEQYLLEGRRTLRRQILAYLRWLRGPGRDAAPEIQQRRFTLLRLRFNLALSQLDMFSDVITQRSEHETGVWLAGLDIAAQDALRMAWDLPAPPPIACYLHRGLGGAIRRARTRLPGGGSNPVAIIRIPRERMIGFGIASSLVHEVGHQAAALLDLLASLRPAIQAAGRARSGRDAEAWKLWERWISEIVADAWSIGRVGVASTMGLLILVSLPRAFVFRVGENDPHPFSWIRVQLSCAIGNALYPDRQWNRIARLWETLYPPTHLKPAELQRLRSLMATMPDFVRLLVEHRPPALHGRRLGDVIRQRDRTPRQLVAMYGAWRRDPTAMRRTPPAVAFAVVGQARSRGLLSPEQEDSMLGRLITFWALDSTMQENSASVLRRQRDRAAASAAAVLLTPSRARVMPVRTRAHQGSAGAGPATSKKKPAMPAPTRPRTARSVAGPGPTPPVRAAPTASQRPRSGGGPPHAGRPRRMTPSLRREAAVAGLTTFA
jgi:hypothetical protein